MDYTRSVSSGEEHHYSNQNEIHEILPKKLPNPCKDSITRQNLHRELMFNQKTGKQVLNQKSELQKAMEKQRFRNFKSAHEMLEEKNAFQKVLEERAKRLETLEKPEEEVSSPSADENVPEFYKIHAKIQSNKPQ